MKSLSLAILLSLLAALARAQTVSIQGTGDMANVTLIGGSAQIIINVDAGTDANGNPATLLDFDVITFNPDGTTTDQAGFGFIPNNAFTSQGTNRMNLTVDTSQVAGFTNTTCITTNSGVACSPSRGGPIQVAWTANGILSQADTQHSTNATGPITVNIDDHGVSKSANVQGSALGFAFSDTGSGFNNFIGSNRQHIITITKG